VKTIPFLASFLLLATLAHAADFAGNWIGKIDVKDESSGTDISTSVKFEFVQTGETVSGTVGRQEDVERVPIRNVKIDGNRITFEASNGETSKPVVFELTVAGDTMAGNMQTALDNETLTGKVSVSRSKN
jgi:hypothetical protein